MPGFLIDLDGTMYAGRKPIPRAAEFIEWLRRRDYPFLFVTNNSSRKPEQVAEHLFKICGIPVTASEIYTSAQAAARYIADRQPDARVWMIGEEGLRTSILQAGLALCNQSDGEGAATSEPTDPAQQLPLQQPDFVIQGIDRSFHYFKLLSAARYIIAGSAYVLTNPDHLVPTDEGFSPGAGSLSASIRTASGVEPVVIGKPSPIIMNYAIERLGLKASDVWVVGDNLLTDIKGGHAVNARTALVLTGVVTAEHLDEQIAETGVRPDLVCEHLMELPDKLF